MTPQPQSTDVLQEMMKQAIALSEHLGKQIHITVEQATENIGKTIAPLAENPAVKTIARIPGVNWLVLWMGQVDTEKVAADVARLRTQYPADDAGAIAQRIINDTALQAGGIGLITNIVPPVALALLAVDLAAVTKLQAEMVYRIAAAYGFDVNDAVRRGEVIAMYGLSFSTGMPLKTGLSIVELIPVVGVVVGASSDAILLYVLGAVARQFYEAKLSSRQPPA